MLALVAAGCGGSSKPRTPDLSRVPMVPGARVVEQVKVCDRGAAAYCGLEVVIVDRSYRSSEDFLSSERDYLHAHGWTGASGDIGDENAADSPGHRLHLSFATAGGELHGIDLSWITRSPRVKYALVNSVFDSTAALGMVLQLGDGN